MKHDCESLKAYLGSFSLVKQCDVVKDNSLRIATPFQYPDGSLIDVFLKGEGDLWETLELSDKGYTTAYLLDLQIKHWTTIRRKTIVSDICKSLGVMHDGGVFKTRILTSEIESIPDHLVRLAQACIRVTDVAFTQRFRTQGVFLEDMEEFLSGIQVPYEAGVSLPGRFRKQVEFDFLVKGKKVSSIIQTVSSASSAAHILSNEVYRKWVDISHIKHAHRCLTVYDSNSDAMRPDDLERIGEVSEVIAFPAEEDRLRESLTA